MVQALRQLFRTILSLISLLIRLFSGKAFGANSFEGTILIMLGHEKISKPTKHKKNKILDPLGRGRIYIFEDIQE